MSIATRINNLIGGAVNTVKKDYGYFKKGIKSSMQQDPTLSSQAKQNAQRMKNIQEGNPEKNLNLDKY